MKCSSPKIILFNYEGSEYQFFVPCGHCYACQCNKRAEWSLRAQYELDDNKTAFFCTLTYDNEYLPAPYLSPRQRVLEVNKQMLEKNIWHRKWDKFLVDKIHVSRFLQALQKYCRTNSYIPSKDLVRYVLTAEYGTVTHRPHYHCLLFFKSNLHKSDVENVLSKVWHFGKCHCGASFGNAAINYVGKHQVKSDCGCEFQQKASPIFSRVSRFGGGIGRTMKNDLTLRLRYFDDDQQNYIENRQGSIIYKIAYPRFLTNFYNKNKVKDDIYYSNKSNEHYDNFHLFMTETSLLFPSLVVKGNDRQTFYNFVERLKQIDYENRCKYENVRYTNKVLKLNNNINNAL